MSVTLEKIYYTAMRKYDMKLVAGSNGIWNNISWLHILEDKENAKFLNGEELVLVTGIGTRDEESLLAYVERIASFDAGGLVINIGPYITEVPDSVLDFGNNNNFPIFTVPWDVKLVDLSREFGTIIIEGEHDEKNMCASFRGAILSHDEEMEYMPFFEKNPNLLSKKYCIIKCYPKVEESEKEVDMTKLYYDLRRVFERVMNRKREDFVIFRYDNYLNIIVPDTNREECDEIIKEFTESKGVVGVNVRLCFAVSKYNLKIKDLHVDFESLSYMCRLMLKGKNDIWHWEDLGIWGMIFAIGNRKQLKEFREINIGEIEKYDYENNTDYCNVLDKYLILNGNMPEAAAECYLHRNTFAYHLRKISEMVNCDIYSTQDRVRLFIALRIKELMELQ